MNSLPPPPQAPPALVAQVLPRCGSVGVSGNVVTPYDGYNALGCSAPVGDGGSGYVRIVPQVGGLSVQPDQPPIPDSSYPGIAWPGGRSPWETVGE